MAALEGFLTSVYAGDDVKRPTFFELVAAEQLMDALRPAARFIVSSLADRAAAGGPMLWVATRWEHLYDLFLLLLQGYHLRVNGASLAEHFFGLKRQEALPARKLSALEIVELERRRQQATTPLTRRQWLGSLLALVVLPSARLRCEASYRNALGQSPSRRSVQQRLWVAIYPWVHSSAHALALAFRFLYLIGRTDTWSPALYLLNLHLARHFPDPPLPSSEGEAGWLQRAQSLASTAGSYSLWGMIYGMQFLQWWYARQHLLQPFRPRKVPPPPPARPPYELPTRPSQQGVPPKLVLLPQDRSLCGICLRVRRNPAASTAGYVFCYPCLVRHVRSYGACPATGVPMAPGEERRIRDGSEGAQ